MALSAFGKFTVAAILLAFITACASTSGYQASNGRVGFTDQALDSGRYRITYEGNSSTDLATVENYVLFRAAEVTLANGHDYFIILDSNTDAMRRFVTSGTGFGGTGFGRSRFFYGRGFHSRFGSRFGGGFGGGFGGTATTRERRSYTVGTIIEIRRGDKPAGDPDAYDARQIIDNIGPTIER